MLKPPKVGQKAFTLEDAMLDTGDANPRIRAALAGALEIGPTIVARTFAETRNQQAEYAQQLATHQEARKRQWFRPHIQIKTDIFLARSQ